VLDFAVEASRPQIDAAGHVLATDLPDAPVSLHADPTRLAQVVSNLLNNAARYTPAGGRITLAARVAEGHVEIDVTDTGIGVPPEMRAKIFDLFAQVKRPTERAQEGLGIGLALGKQLMELHGGTITLAATRPGEGSTFRLLLPILED
jgi:signal transduction histidine kinase